MGLRSSAFLCEEKRQQQGLAWGLQSQGGISLHTRRYRLCFPEQSKSGRGPGAAEGTVVQIWLQPFPGVLKMIPWPAATGHQRSYQTHKFPGSTGSKTQGLWGDSNLCFYNPSGRSGPYSRVRTSALGKGAGEGRI